MKKDITMYSDDELSLMVFNDEGLYEIRGSSYFMEFLEDNFEFTADQRAVLEFDLGEEEAGEVC